MAASAPFALTSESADHADPRGYFPVLVAALIGMPELRCDVYIQAEGSGRKILYRAADSDLSLAEDQRLQERGVRHLFLRNYDRDRYEEALQKATRPQDASIMLALTLERRRDAFEAAVLGGTPAQVVAMANQVAGDVLQIINDDRFAVVEAMSLLEHDRSTFQHSCNVAVYSATLAKRLGFSDGDLTLLIAGAMVHDIGKRDIPAYILRKPGLLDAREKELIRQHPGVGFGIVAPLGQLTWKQRMMVYQHHEKIDGTGYPVGAVGKEIDLWARLCAVADVFDALTAKRPYREQSPTAGAIEIMQNEKGHFDPDLLKLWTEIVA